MGVLRTLICFNSPDQPHLGPPTHPAHGLRMLFKLKPGLLVLVCGEMFLVLPLPVLAHRWIFF